MPIACISMTSHGIVGPGMPIPGGVPANFPLKQAAVMDFHSGRPFQGEAKYKDYYDDLVDNEQEWLAFLRHEMNTTHTEHTCGILETLAKIYRQRGSFEQCGQVLDMEFKVMQIYKELSTPGAPAGVDANQIYCCDGLEYKMNIIRFNLNNNLNQLEASISIFRDLCLHELIYKKSFDEQQFLFVLDAIFGRKPTAKEIRALSDEQVLRTLELSLPMSSDSPEHEEAVAKGKRRTALLFCDNCRKQETSVGEFKTCTRCSQAPYQKAAWKQHKKVCGKN